MRKPRIKSNWPVRVLSLVLLLVIPCLTVLHVFAHKQQQKEVKRFLERSVGMALSEDLFLPNTTEFQYVQKGDEIVFGGNKYDILSVTVVAGGYQVKAFNDKIEKALEDQIAQQCEKGSGGSSKAKHIWFDKLQWAVNEEVDAFLGPPVFSKSFERMRTMGLVKGVGSVTVPPSGRMMLSVGDRFFALVGAAEDVCSLPVFYTV